MKIVDKTNELDMEHIKWSIAKITKKGYTTTGDQQIFKYIMTEFKNFGISLTAGKEYGWEPEAEYWIIEPNKRNGKKIAKYVKEKLGIEPENYFS